MYAIRAAAPEDASRLAEILIFAKRAAYRPIFRDDYVSFQEMRVLDLALHYRDDAGALEDVYVCEADGVVQGMMSWARGEGAWELHELYVDPFFQGGGVGRALMRSFLEAARRGGARRAWLWVLEENGRARSFYEKCGFAWTGAREEFSGSGKCLLRYAREIREGDGY